jgi:hypothetical protein
MSKDGGVQVPAISIEDPQILKIWQRRTVNFLSHKISHVLLHGHLHVILGPQSQDAARFSVLSFSHQHQIGWR